MELEILTSLETAHPRKLKQTTVETDVRRATDGFTLTEVNRALSILERKEQIRIHTGEDVTRLEITTDGLSRLANAR